MLAISSAKNDIEIQMENTMPEDHTIAVDFPDFPAGINLLDSIDFDDLFVGIGDGDFLPDLEMDPHDINPAAGEDSPSVTPELEPRVGSGSSSPPCEKRKKSIPTSKNTHGKRKVKVDWTPELHKRFVQAVEQLGVDKAVPSRILELMGIDCLTRHNIASHLQKYRSHRKHLLAREAEAASWSQRRQMYGGGGGPVGKRSDHVSPWITPIMGLPMPHFRPPLHVWGHPSVDQSMMPVWQKHLTPLPPPHAWPPPPPENPYWIPQHHVPMQGMPCFPPHLPPTRFPGMYKSEDTSHVAQGQTTITQPPSDVHPSKESVDAAIGDVLTKPWLPLPLGLKPPSVDSVIVELQRQGIPKIPPTCTA